MAQILPFPRRRDVFDPDATSGTGRPIAAMAMASLLVRPARRFLL
jgi:hypothetical protein